MSLVTVGSIAGKAQRDRVKINPKLALSPDELELAADIMFEKHLKDLKQAFTEGFIIGYNEGRVI